MLSRAHHHQQLGRPSETFRHNSFHRAWHAAWRFFNPAVAWPVAGILAVALVTALYGIALVHAQQRYLDLRARYCTHLVEGFYARNPRLRSLKLVDACLEWEQLSGEAIR